MSTSSVRVTWDNDEKTIIRYDFATHWTFEQFYAEKIVGDKLIDEAGHNKPVGVLFVLPRQVGLPQDVLHRVGSGLKTRHPRAIFFVVVSNNFFVVTMTQTLHVVYPSVSKIYQIAPTLEAARELVNQRLLVVNKETIS